MVLKRLHHGGNDKYFLLADSAWRSLARFGVSILVAKLAGADVFGLLVILLAIEVIVTTLLSAWQLMPAINTGPGADSVERDQLGCHIIIGSIRWASLISVAGALLWGLMGFAGAGIGVGLGFVAMVWVACLLQAVRAWRSICFESWHVFWADLVALGVPLLAIWLTFRVDGPDSLLASWAWASALSGLLAGALMLGRRGWVMAGAPRLDKAWRERLSRQSAPLLIGSLANAVGSRAHPMILAALAVSIEVARFGAVLTLVGPLRMLGMALSGIVRPRFALYYTRCDEAMARRLMLKACLLVVALGVAMATGVLWAGERVARLLFGDWFTDPKLVLLLGLSYGMAACIASFVVTAIQTRSDKGPAFTARLRILVSIGMVVLGAVGAALWGAEGVLIALCLAEGAYLAIAFRYWLAAESQERAGGAATA